MRMKEKRWEGKLEKEKAIGYVFPLNWVTTVQLPAFKWEFLPEKWQYYLFIFFFDAAKLGCQQNKFWIKMFWPALPETLN